MLTKIINGLLLRGGGGGWQPNRWNHIIIDMVCVQIQDWRSCLVAFKLSVMIGLTAHHRPHLNYPSRAPHSLGIKVGGTNIVPEHHFFVPHVLACFYRKTSNIRGTESQNFNVSRHVLQLSLPNPLKPSVKSRMKMQLEQCQQALLQLHLSDQQFYCLLMYNLY